MRVNRRFLFWGVLLVAIGGVLVAADLGAIDTSILADVIRLWPLAIIAIGVSVILRRTTFSLPAILAAALIPGLVVGAAFAVAPRFAGACGVRVRGGRAPARPAAPYDARASARAPARRRAAS